MILKDAAVRDTRAVQQSKRDDVCIHGADNTRLVQTATLQHESANIKDKNALLLESDRPGSIWGYLPRGVSQHLASLVKEGSIGSCATITELGATATSAIGITLEVAPLLLLLH